MRTSFPAVAAIRRSAVRFGQDSPTNELRFAPSSRTAWRISVLGLVCAVIFCVFATGLRLEAQQATALLTGTVRDTSGAVVVGAKVTLRNAQTNISRSLNSDKDGNYLFTLIPIGTYEVIVEQQGFDKYVRKGITLEINQNAHLDIPLKIGTTSQVVEVTGRRHPSGYRQRHSRQSRDHAAHPATCRWSSVTRCNSDYCRPECSHPTRMTARAIPSPSAASAPSR